MKLKYIILGLCALIGFSCTDQAFVEKYSSDTEYVKVSANIFNGSRVCFEESDSLTFPYFEIGDSITLNTTLQGSRNYVADHELEDGWMVFNLVQGEWLKNTEGEIVYSTYPATHIQDGVATLPATNIWKNENKASFMYATSSINNAEVKFQFNHPYSYLKFTLAMTSDVLSSITTSDGDKTIHRLWVESASGSLSVVKGTFDFENQSMNISESSKSVEIILEEGYQPEDSLVERTVYIPILPQEANVEMSIYALHDTENGCDTLFKSKKQTPSTGFLAGNVYRTYIRGSVVPKLEAISCNEVTSTSVSVTSSIIDSGSSSVSEIGFCYSVDNQEPNKETDKFIDLSDQKDNESFGTVIEGLEVDTTYYIRAYAVNADGVGYSDVFNYTPLDNSVDDPIDNPGIYSLEDWREFCVAKNSGVSDLSKWKDTNGIINLYADLDFSEVNILSQNADYFQEYVLFNSIDEDEILDGNDHVITGFSYSMADFNVYLIRENLGTIKNLHLGEGQISGGVFASYDVAAFCLENSGTIMDCSSKVMVYSYLSKAASFCTNNKGTILRCINRGDIISGYEYESDYGSAAGIALGGTVIDCQNYGIVSGKQASGIGGANVSNSINYGTIGEIYENTDYGISFNAVADDAAGVSITGTVNNSVNEGNVTSSNRGGGIVAYLDNEDVVSNSTNNGAIVSNGYCGGIIGVILKTSVFYVAGNVNTNGGTVNGISGDDTNAIGGDERNGVPSIDGLPTGKWYYNN